MHATVRLAGSTRQFRHPGGADPDHLGPLSARALSQPTAVTVHLRERPHAETLRVRLARESVRAGGHRHLTRAGLHDTHGAAFDDIAAVARWASAVGLDIGYVDAATRRMELSGSLSALASAFAVTLEQRRAHDWRTGLEVAYRDHRDELRIPAQLDGVVTAVLGLSDRPLGRPRLAVAPAGVSRDASFTPEMLAGIYEFPVLEGGGAGRSITVGIAELGGAVDPSDLAALQASMPRLRLIEEGIHGARPRPDRSGADTEVALDWQVIARVVQHCAPAADLTLVVRYAPNTDRGFTDLVASFAGDGRDYAAVSTSWGCPEDFWTPVAMEEMDRGFQLGAARGIAHCVAAGDNGSADGLGDGGSHADHPASAPHALSCGGTTVRTGADGTVTEVAWNERAAGQGATGGGVSNHFATPHYQTSAGLDPRSANDGRRGRGVPDVAANADPMTGYRFRHRGAEVVVGGTSAVAPLWSALLAVSAADSGRRPGFVHPSLYACREHGFRDVTRGGNGAYSATAGWDPVTGLGSPRGRQICDALGRDAPLRTHDRRAVGRGALVGRELD